MKVELNQKPTGSTGRSSTAPLNSNVICIVTRNVTLYTFSYDPKFKHNGLEKFFLKGTKSGIQAKHGSKLRLILGRLNASINTQDMNLPGLYLHALSGDKGGIWSVRVSGNWRVTFRFVDGDAEIVNYEDCH